MAFDDHKNFAYSLVATAPAPASSGTSLVVTAGEGTRFPTPPFNATIWPTGALAVPTNAEIVRVTAIATDTLTIARAQESSSARTVVVGDQIAATITDKVLTDIEAAAPGFDATVPTSDSFSTSATAAAAGAATTAPRRDHVHGFPALFDTTVPVTQAFSDAAAAGVAAVAARRDHRHGMPASPGGAGLTVLASDVALAEVANSATETTVFTYTVPGGTLGTAGFLRLWCVIEVLNTTGAGMNLQVKAKYGGTVIALGSFSLVTHALRRALWFDALLAAGNATNAQRSAALAISGGADSAANPPSASPILALTDVMPSSNNGLAIDSTADQVFSLTFQWAASTPTTSAKLHTAHLVKG